MKAFLQNNQFIKKAQEFENEKVKHFALSNDLNKSKL